MKKVLLLCFLFVGFKAFAQDAPPSFTPPLKEGRVYYEKVVEVAGKEKDAIFTKALDWYLGKFKGLEFNLTTNDLDLGRLAGNGRVQISEKGIFGMTTIYNVDFDLQLDVKDGKYRYIITNIRHTPEGVTKSSTNSEYLFNIPEERDIAISKGEVKGYSKGKKQAAVDRMIAIEQMLTDLMQNLNKALNVKQDDF